MIGLPITQGLTQMNARDIYPTTASNSPSEAKPTLSIASANKHRTTQAADRRRVGCTHNAQTPQIYVSMLTHITSSINCSVWCPSAHVPPRLRPHRKAISLCARRWHNWNSEVIGHLDALLVALIGQPLLGLFLCCFLVAVGTVGEALALPRSLHTCAATHIIAGRDDSQDKPSMRFASWLRL